MKISLLQVSNIVFYDKYYKMLVYFQYKKFPNHHFDTSCI